MGENGTSSAKPVTAGLVIIGNEILSGRTRDANLQFLGDELNRIGIRLTEVRVVNDVPAAIVEAVNTCLLYTSPSPRDQRGSRMPSSA